jgi:hypothetical protein
MASQSPKRTGFSWQEKCKTAEGYKKKKTISIADFVNGGVHVARNKDGL